MMKYEKNLYSEHEGTKRVRDNYWTYLTEGRSISQKERESKKNAHIKKNSQTEKIRLNRFRAAGDLFDSKVKLLEKVIGKNTHNGESGSYNERIFMSLLNENLNDIADVCTGFVVITEENLPYSLNDTYEVSQYGDGEIKISTQQDILIVKKNSSHLFVDNNYVVTNAKNVLASIEIKSTFRNNSYLELREFVTKQIDSVTTAYDYLDKNIRPWSDDHDFFEYDILHAIFYCDVLTNVELNSSKFRENVQNSISDILLPSQIIGFGTSCFISHIPKPIYWMDLEDTFPDIYYNFIENGTDLENSHIDPYRKLFYNFEKVSDNNDKIRDKAGLSFFINQIVNHCREKTNKESLHHAECYPYYKNSNKLGFVEKHPL